MDQQSFSKEDITREAAIDISNDPLELIKLLSGDTAKRARNDAEIEAVTQEARAMQAAYLQPAQLTIPQDWDSAERTSFCVIHHGVESVEITATSAKPKRSSATTFGKPAADSKGIAKNTTVQDDWQAPSGCGTLSNCYVSVPLQSKSTGQRYSVNIVAGVSFIDPDLFDGEFTSQPLREAVERGMISVLPPNTQFKIKLLSKALREKMAIGALQHCSEASDLQWHAALVPGTEIAKHINRKITSLEE